MNGSRGVKPTLYIGVVMENDRHEILDILEDRLHAGYSWAVGPYI